MLMRLRQIWRTTAVRLTLLYTIMFGALSALLVVYVGYGSGQLLIEQIRNDAEEEVRGLANTYRFGGARALIRTIERRSRNPGSDLYLVTDQKGRIIVGNVKHVPTTQLARDGWSATPFTYQPFDTNRSGPHRAIARVFDLPGGLKLLVGRDIGEADRFREIIGQALAIAALLMLFLALAAWFVIGKRALHRIDLVSQASARITAGDLSERLPVSGTGDEFDRLSTHLNAMIARLERLNDGVKVVSDNIAHDLKTPLTRLRNRADAALQSASMSNQQREDSFQSIVEDADGLINTFNALLMISQVDSGANSIPLAPVALEDVVTDVHELFEPSAEAEGVELRLIKNVSTKVDGNRELLALALTNLLDNALKYGRSQEGSVIEMALDTDGDQVVLCVADNGVGIEEHDRERVLERFVRLEASRSKPGTGLGLSLVQSVAKLHGGAVEFSDNKPGLRVCLRLPYRG